MQLGMLIAYFVILVAIGAYFTRASKVATGDDFIFAGRRLPRPVLVGTLLATWVGSGTIIGGANFAYTYGPLASIFFFAGTPAGIVVLYFAARRVRALSRYTVPELLEIRFGTPARMVAAVVILLAYVGITAYQFIGGGYVLSLLTPLSAEGGTILIAVLVTFIAVGGGLFSVAYTDFLSVVIILFSLVVAVPLVLSDLGGLGAYFTQLPAESQTWQGGLSTMQLLGFFLPLFLLILADQNMYQRLTAAQDEGTAQSSTVGFFFGAFVVVIPVALLASAASILMPDIEPDTAVLSLAAEGHLPMFIGGLILAGGMAFIITTGSSFLLSGAGNLLYDFYVRFKGQNVTEVRRLRLHRVAVAVLALAAYGLGEFFPTVLELQIYSYTIYGVAITPAVLAALFWKRVTAAGAMAAMLAGTVATLLWEFPLDQPYDWNSVLIALPVAVLVLVIVSLFTQPSKERQEKLRAEE